MSHLRSDTALKELLKQWPYLCATPEQGEVWATTKENGRRIVDHSLKQAGLGAMMHTFCSDCTPEYRSEMTAVDRCIRAQIMHGKV